MFRSKFNEHTGKVSDKFESYIHKYSQVLGAYEHSPHSVLEIGVQNGGSLEIWSQCFPNASSILGVDVLPACGDLQFSDPRIEVIVGDVKLQSTLSEIVSHANQFHLVVDDGSHIQTDVIQAFGNLFEFVVPGGLYVIEDLHTSYWSSHQGGLRMNGTTIEFLKDLVDISNTEIWEVEVDKEALLASLAAKYKVPKLPMSIFEISEITFQKSLCLIWKKNVFEDFGLGKRRVAGSAQDVLGGFETLDESYLETPQKTFANVENLFGGMR